MTSNEKQLRKLLWWHHDGHSRYLYGDDGEMQCNKCMIDFKRDSVKRIIEVFDGITMTFLKQSQKILNMLKAQEKGVKDGKK